VKPVFTGRELVFAPGIREQNRSIAVLMFALALLIVVKVLRSYLCEFFKWVPAAPDTAQGALVGDGGASTCLRSMSAFLPVAGD